MNRSNLHPYQEFTVNHIIEHEAAGVFLDMGLGKTVSTLTALDELLNDYCQVNRVLVIAPKRVAENTWTTEASRWDYLKHLKISLVLGSTKKRKEALARLADIYVINRENVPWLVSYYQSAFPFDMVVIDELSSFKDHSTSRFKALRLVRPQIKRVVGLTGTPAPNSLIDLWAQMYLLDQGQRLGKFITHFKDRFFRYNHYSRKYKAEAGTEDAIYKLIGDICVSMKSEDYIKLPERIDRTIEINLPADVQKQYDDFERDCVMSMDEEEISAINAAALSIKLRQFANGAIYDDDKNWHEIHEVKLDALEELVEAALGEPVLIFYDFKHDAERILKRLKAYKPRMLNTSKDIDDWNQGKIEVMLAHPASAGHGLNLQMGGNIIIWFALNWSLEKYQQANKRIHRQGQKRVVTIFKLVMQKTIDPRICETLEQKKEGQDALMEAIKAIIKKHKSSI